MAGTKYAYVRNFELPDMVIPDVYMVVRIDGKGFHKFSKTHEFEKPNDPKALELMNEAARYVMNQLKGQVAMAFGESDEYSFLLRKSCTLYNRRISKITTHIVSLFTSAYLFNWSKFFPTKPLFYPPSFDGRLVVYPNEKTVRDYFAWRQADTHINNLYNTTFWALVLQGSQTEQEATKTLEGTVSAEKQEILFSKFSINYDQLEPMFRKGTTIVYTSQPSDSSLPSSISPTDTTTHEKVSQESNDPDTPLLNNKKDERLRLKIQRKRQSKLEKRLDKQHKKSLIAHLSTLHCDIISDEFWISSSSISVPPTLQDLDQPWSNPIRFIGSGLGSCVLMD